MSFTPHELNLFVVQLVAARHRWEQHVRHTNDTRVYEQIWDDEHVNAWVICWSEDQDTGFHDHDRSAAAIAVVDGHVAIASGLDPLAAAPTVGTFRGTDAISTMDSQVVIRAS